MNTGGRPDLVPQASMGFRLMFPALELVIYLLDERYHTLTDLLPDASMTQ